MIQDIVHYADLYTIDTLGNVRSKCRTIINKNGKPQQYPGKLLKFDYNQYGHKRVTLSKNHKVNRYQVHRLVAEAFLPNPLDKPCINHLDNDPGNNNIANIEWCTHSENMLHAQKQGRLFKSQSKGGKTLGIIGTRNTIVTKKLIGSKINNWTILSFAEHRKYKKYFNVQCNCGNLVTKEQYYIMHNTQNGCIKCKQRG